jgi:HlyD family secretion protein
MSTSPNPTASEPDKRRRSRVAIWSAVSLLVLAAIGGGVVYFVSAAGATEAEGEFFTVRRDDLVIKVVGNGTANPLKREIVKSEVEGRNVIDFLISQGPVEKGQVLVRLNTSNLENQISEQDIRARNAHAAKTRAEESLAVTLSQNRSDISKADLDVQFAKQNYQKYIEGEYPQELAKAEADITIAKVEKGRAEDKLNYSQQLYDKGFITRTELEADTLSVTRAKLDLKLAEGRKRLLEEYTYVQRTQQLKSDIEQAEMNLDRVKRKANADEIQARADLEARTTEAQRQQERYDKLKAQLDKCVMRAPISGEAVYATTSEGRWHRRSNETLEEGQEVREGQEIIHIPQPGDVKVEMKIQESDIAMLRDAVEAGENRLPVRVTTGVNEKTYWGELVTVSPNASQASWWEGGARQYDAEVHITRDVSGLEAGMPVEAEIIIEQLEDVLFVPLQAIVRENGVKVVYVRDGDRVEARLVEVGRNDNTHAHVLEGLEPGEQVSLNPPLNRSLPGAQQQVDPDEKEDEKIPETSKKTGQETPEASKGDEELTFEKFKAMSSQERRQTMQKLGREKIREFFNSLTDEQKKELGMGAGRGGGRERGRPGGRRSPAARGAGGGE